MGDAPLAAHDFVCASRKPFAVVYERFCKSLFAETDRSHVYVVVSFISKTEFESMLLYFTELDIYAAPKNAPQMFF